MKGKTCCEKCLRTYLDEFRNLEGNCANENCPCHSTHTEVDAQNKLGAIFGQLYTQEPTLELLQRVEAEIATLIPSIEQSVVEAIEAKLPTCWPKKTPAFQAGYDAALKEIRTIIKAFKKEI